MQGRYLSSQRWSCWF